MRKRTFCLLLLLAVTVCLLTGCKPKRVTKEIEKTAWGIDVARYQGTINWTEVKASGVEFAMVRLGYRGVVDGEITPDSNGRYNLQEATRVGIPVGAYFFSTATTEEEAREEARWAAEILNDYSITYPVAYDCESFDDADSRQYDMTKKERTDMALAFLKEIEELGYEGMFYSSKNMMHMDTKWETSRIEKKYKIWVAQYPDLPYPMTPESSYEGTHQMWQYSMKGSVEGVRSDVDLNVAYFAYDGIEPAKNKEPPETVGPDVEAMMTFTEVCEEVTAKNETNLRSIPSQDDDSKVLYTLKNGESALRIATSSSGWSKLEYNGEVVYAVSTYLELLNGEEDPNEIHTKFYNVHENVTAKDVVNLRKMPSVEHEGAVVITQLKNGEVALRVGYSDNGWSKLEYNGQTCYAVTQYLLTLEESDDPTAATGTAAAGEAETLPPVADDADFQMNFTEVNEKVTAKNEVNLRNIPSTDRSDSQVIAKLKHGDVATRTGVNKELGWSRVQYSGRILYCVTRYLERVE